MSFDAFAPFWLRSRRIAAPLRSSDLAARGRESDTDRRGSTRISEHCPFSVFIRGNPCPISLCFAFLASFRAWCEVE